MRGKSRAWSSVGAIPLILFLLLPPFALLLRGRSVALRSLDDPSVRSAIFISLKTTTITLALVIALGLPICALLARSRSWLVRLIDGFVDLPVVLPPAAAGIGLLIAFGRYGLLHTGLPFTVGAVICAQLFVSAPLFLRSGTAAILSVPPEVIEMAKTEGAGLSSLFFRMVLPLGGPIFLAGALMSWARSLGEFGATLLFAGNLPGKTQTMPLAIYLGFEADLDQAIGLSVILLTIAGVILLLSKFLISWRTSAFSDGDR